MTSNLNANSVLFVEFRSSQCTSYPRLRMGRIQLCGSLLPEIWLWRSSGSVFLCERLLQRFNENVDITYTGCMHRAHSGVESTSTILRRPSMSQPPLVVPKYRIDYEIIKVQITNFILVDMSINFLISD